MTGSETLTGLHSGIPTGIRTGIMVTTVTNDTTSTTSTVSIMMVTMAEPVAAVTTSHGHITDFFPGNWLVRYESAALNRGSLASTG
jgi:hypothetical protein